MHGYDIKKNHKLDQDILYKIVTDLFGNCTVIDKKIHVIYGALNPLAVWIDNKKLMVESNMKKDVTSDVAIDTIKKYNKFLEYATGMTVLERVKKEKKKVEKNVE
ncbi:MAG: DUF5611 family protein [Candidatus Thermoplasmatota archaeon]|jgi:hypothetical protein|nr:DUF5611 family protein [Candidatus Thermoplasmatota archaeon]